MIMKFRNALLGAAALLSATIGAVQAQPNWVPPGNDSRGYYSEFDRNGYYDRDGHYQRIRGDRGGPYNQYGPPPGPSAYYQSGRYEQNCRSGNAAAVIGGAVLGGLLGNTIARDIDCDDQPVAFNVYAQGLNGDLNRRYDWRGRNGYGYFTPVREYRRGGVVCRDFTETTYRNGREF